MPGIHVPLPHEFLKKDRLALIRLDARGKGSVGYTRLVPQARVALHAQVSVSGVPQTYCIQYLFLQERSLRLSKTYSYTIPAFSR